MYFDLLLCVRLSVCFDACDDRLYRRSGKSQRATTERVRKENTREFLARSGYMYFCCCCTAVLCFSFEFLCVCCWLLLYLYFFSLVIIVVVGHFSCVFSSLYKKSSLVLSLFAFCSSLLIYTLISFSPLFSSHLLYRRVFSLSLNALQPFNHHRFVYIFALDNTT